MEDLLLVALDNRVRASDAIDSLSEVVTALLRSLDGSPERIQAWQPIDSQLFATELSQGIKSAWLFVLRPGGIFPAERHPNSWQRSVVLRGRALFELYVDNAWREHPLDSAGASVGERAISIQPGTWHRIAVGSEPVVSVSFHTVPAEELIEETCVDNDFSRTRSRRYEQRS